MRLLEWGVGGQLKYFPKSLFPEHSFKSMSSFFSRYLSLFFFFFFSWNPEAGFHLTLMKVYVHSWVSFCAVYVSMETIVSRLLWNVCNPHKGEQLLVARVSVQTCCGPPPACLTESSVDLNRQQTHLDGTAQCWHVCGAEPCLCCGLPTGCPH